MSGLLDIVTGGKNQAAEDALNQAKAVFAGLNVPSIASMTMPELQQYVNAGIITPAQAQAVNIDNNAYNLAKTDPAALQAQVASLNTLQEIGQTGGLTPTAQAQITQANQQAATQLQGQRASILDQAAQRGIPTSLMAVASQENAAGQDAQNAMLASTNAAANAQQQALTALANAGTLGGQIESQQYTEQANKASAQNAINQWNAANQTAVNQANVAAQNTAKQLNQANAQNVANQNTGLANQQTAYNVALPQTQFQMALQKAQGQAGADTNIAQNAMQQGQQTENLLGSLVGAGGQIGAASLLSPAAAAPSAGTAAGATGLVALAAEGGRVHEMRQGGPVPGNPNVPGDSLHNDTVKALLSPGEVVVPRTVVNAGPETAQAFLREVGRMRPPMRPSSDDVQTVLKALAGLHEPSFQGA